MHESKKQIMNPFSTQNYSVAQRDDWSFVITPKENTKKYLKIFEAEEVKPLCDNLLLVRRNFFSHYCVYSISQKDYISLPIYNNINAEGKYFIFERSGKFGIAVIAYGKFFEVTPPEYTCILGITHGTIVFQEKENYGVHNIFSNFTVTSKKPIKLSEKGNIIIANTELNNFLGLISINKKDSNLVAIDEPFAYFYSPTTKKTTIFYIPLSTKVYEGKGKLDCPQNQIEDFLIKDLTK